MKPFIISMLLKGPKRSRDLNNDSEDFAKRVLLQQLSELEEDRVGNAVRSCGVEN